MNVSTDKELKLYIEMIAVESNFVANYVNKLGDMLPGFLGRLSQSKDDIEETQKRDKSFSEEAKENIPLSKNYKEALDKFNFINFVTASNEMIVSIPENFSGNLKDFIKTLIKLSSDFHQTSIEFQKEYNAILGSFITNKEDKISLKDHSSLFKKVTAEREKTLAIINSFFPNNNHLSKTTLGKIVSNPVEIKDLFSEADKLATIEIKTNLDSIKDGVKKSSDFLSIIIEGIKEGTITNISPNAAKNLAEGAYEMAKVVELNSILHFDILLALGAVKNLTLSVKEYNQ